MASTYKLITCETLIRLWKKTLNISCNFVCVGSVSTFSNCAKVFNNGISFLLIESNLRKAVGHQNDVICRKNTQLKCGCCEILVYLKPPPFISITLRLVLFHGGLISIKGSNMDSDIYQSHSLHSSVIVDTINQLVRPGIRCLFHFPFMILNEE